MQTIIQGVLVDPFSNPLPNHKIRITSRVTSVSIEETVVIQQTDSNGNYSFILVEGWHYLEVLNKDTYMLVGDLLIDGGTPSPINLNDLLNYSTPVTPTIISNYSNSDQALLDTLESGSFSTHRDKHNQIVDVLVHNVDVNSVTVSNDELERNASSTSELKSCDSIIVDESMVYSDSESNFIASTGSKVSTGLASITSSTILNNDINIDNLISRGMFSGVVTHSVNDSGSNYNEFFDTGDSSNELTVNLSPSEAIKEQTLTTASGELKYNLNNTTGAHTKEFTSLFESQLLINNISNLDGISTKEYSSLVGTKSTSNTHTNDGTSTVNKIVVDDFIVGRQGNNTFEVDSDTDTVFVRGKLRVTQIQDADGNDLDIKDGDTIFDVHQYSDASTGPWHDVLLVSDRWRRDNVSINGVINPNTWSIAYKFIGEDGVGQPGDTIYIEYNYSVDGATNWHVSLQAGDAYRRERVVINGVPGPWSEINRIVGDSGDEIEIRSQYSIDGINLWHDTFINGDKYERRARFVNGLINSSWSDPFKIVSTSAFKSTVFIRSTGKPNLPTGGSWGTPVPDGWSDGIPEGELQLWGSTRIFTLDGSSPQQESWTPVQSMTDTEILDFEYSAFIVPDDPTTSPTKWHNIATEADIYMAMRRKVNGVWGAWEITKVKGEDGDQGIPAFKSIVFRRFSGTPPLPTGGSWASPIPANWSDGIPSGELQLWSSTRIFTSDGSSPQQSVWTAVRAMTDTASIDFEFSAVAINANPGTPETDPNNWHNISTPSDNWMAQRTKLNGVWGPWQVIQVKGEKGEDGESPTPIPGDNGSGWYSIVGNGGNWPGDSTATSAFINKFGRVPQLDDHLFYVNSEVDASNSDGRRCVTPAGSGTPVWNDPQAYFNEDVIVNGTLSARKLVANTLTGNEINSQTTLLAGSGGSTAGMNGYDLATLPDWLGGGTNKYAGYRFWSGATDPALANFSVTSDGIMTSHDGNFSGTITMIGTSGLKVESSTPFGPDDLLEWRGSKVGKINQDGTVNLNNLTKVNATTYYSDDNVAYFGGSIIAGTLTTSVQNPSTNSTVSVSSGTFGSNGGQIAVLASAFSTGNTGFISGSCSVKDDPEVTLNLYQDGTLVKSQTFVGTFDCSSESGGKFEFTFVSGSFTYYDNLLSTSDREYSLTAVFKDTVGNLSQRISLVTQEA